MWSTRTRSCRCGHPVEAHEHFRAGRDCGVCGDQVCPRFTAAGGGLLRRRGRATPDRTAST